MIGQTLSHFRVTALLGKGGMGEVYRAEDTRLHREVAIKLLPEQFTSDPERLARFEREAQLLASLNHPNIAAIYGLEKSADDQFLILELVEGETLQERLERGSMNLGEALDFARQIAEALEAAHDKGIIHRDLKPANIKLTPAGQVKVLDFGLAKAIGPPTNDPGFTHSPTLTAQATREGIILGTAAYMSPEQARGEDTDQQTDIWAFGCVLYMLLTGKRPFPGDSVAEVFAAILEREPDWDRLTGKVPASTRFLLRHCLAKDRHQRLHSIGDARLVLDEALERGELSQPPRKQQQPTLRRAMPWLALPLALAAGWWLRPTPATEPEPAVHAEIVLPAGERMVTAFRHSMALSPDERTLAIVAGTRQGPRPVERSQIYLRALDGWQFLPVQGTEGAEQVAFSPDGGWLAFSAANEPWWLYKVPTGGGEATVVCQCEARFGVAWSADGTLILGGHTGGLLRVPAAGGSPEVISDPDNAAGETTDRLPRILPNGNAVLLTVVGFDMADLSVAVLSLETGERKVLVENASDARYLPTGHLIFARAGRLMAVGFDLDRLEVHGPEVPVLDGVTHSVRTGWWWRETGAAQFDVGPSGLLLYAPGSVLPEVPETLVWVDRQGRETALPIGTTAVAMTRISPDGERFLMTRWQPPQDIWLYDVARETLRRQTFEGNHFAAIWGPGDTHITFETYHEGPLALASKLVDSGPGGLDTLLGDLPRWSIPADWTDNGEQLIFVRDLRDIWVMSRDGEASPFLSTRFGEAWPALSPDGNWLAYVSDESGRTEVYARPFPGPGPAVQISADTGQEPAWSRDGREIFFRRGPGFWAVPVSYEADRLIAGRRELLFEGRYGVSDPTRSYDVDSNGRFLLSKPPDPEIELAALNAFYPDRVRVVQGWLEEIRPLLEGSL